MGDPMVKTMARRLARLTAVVLVGCWVLASPTDARAIEAVSTPVDVRIVFGAGCAGSGTIEVFDPDGRPWLLPDYTPIDRYSEGASWQPGTVAVVTGTINGAASPVLRLLDEAGHELFRVELPQSAPYERRYLVTCQEGRLTAVPDTALVLPGRPVLSALGALAMLIGAVWALTTARRRAVTGRQESART